MATNVKISAMTPLAGASLATGDQFAVAHSGASDSITAGALATGLSPLLPNMVGDVTGPQGTTVVALVGGSTAANVHTSQLATAAAASINTASTIVKRDASGNFTGGTITAATALVGGTISLDTATITSDGSGNLTAVSFVGSGASLTGLGASGFSTQSANRALIGPASGSAVTPTFRALVNADLPLGNATVYVITSANRTTVSGTLVNVTDLSIALAAGATYEFEAHLSVAASAITGNQYGVNFSASGSTLEAQISGTLAAASAQAGRISAIATASATFDTAGADGAIIIKGVIITTSNAGNLTIQHLAVVATTTTATVYANSVLKATRIA